MFTDQSREYHPLLTKDELKEAVVDLGFARNTGGILFNAVVRKYKKTETEPRSADDSVYNEFIHDGSRPEYVISLPNLADKIAELQEVRVIGRVSIEALSILTGPFRPDTTG